MSDVPEELLSSWPPALREEARQGVNSLPRWAQRELRDSHRTAEPDTSLQFGEVLVLEDTQCKDLPQLVPVHKATALAAQVSRLGEVEFQEDALELVDAEGPWAASALVQGGELLGFVVFGVLSGSMWLRYIAVAPRHRKKGYGRRLIEHVCKCCQEQGVLELTLFSKRELVPFYQALGFREVPDEDGDPEDDLQVPLVLSPATLVELPKLRSEATRISGYACEPKEEPAT
eukprot:s66_g32.t1